MEIKWGYLLARDLNDPNQHLSAIVEFPTPLYAKPKCAPLELDRSAPQHRPNAIGKPTALET